MIRLGTRPTEIEILAALTRALSRKECQVHNRATPCPWPGCKLGAKEEEVEVHYLILPTWVLTIRWRRAAEYPANPEEGFKWQEVERRWLGDEPLGTPRHTCHATGCREEIPPALFMCRRHWSMVPMNLRRLIWRYYKPGQELKEDVKPSPEYLAITRAAREAVYAKEKKPL